MQPTLTPWNLLTATGALIAFLIGLYTLVARERKSPYLINSVFWLFLLCLTGAAIDIASALLSGTAQEWALQAGASLLLVAVVCSTYVLYRITIRFVYFIDDPHPKQWPGVRQFRAWRQRSKVEPTYSHNPVPISSDVKSSITEVMDAVAPNAWEDREALEQRSLAIAVDHQGQGNDLLARLALVFLKHGHSVQYLTASRHPIEFIGYLRKKIEDSGEQWQTRCKQIVVIDAYTPHFGFIDSIYRIRTRQLVGLGVAYLRSKRTYAGMHTSASKAFNKIKRLLDRSERHPTLVIYEDCYALSDLESPEQYRIFVRHVLPSERMWDSMFTVFLESAQADADWRLLLTYASMKLDLRESPSKKSAAKGPSKRSQVTG